MMDKEYKYIHFLETGKNTKTKIWNCINNKSDDILGVVKWYGPWRQYCFYPSGFSIFNRSCLADIINFINNQMYLREKKQE